MASGTQEQGPAVAAATARKPRSLADLAEEQVQAGALDPEELSKPVNWNERQRSRGGRGGDRGGGWLGEPSSLNWQQRELLQKDGSGREGGFGQNRGGRRGNGFRGGFDSQRGSRPGQRGGFRAPKNDLPEWATDLDTAPAQSNDTLNWQQRSLMSRDEGNPFNRLVRGEDEYGRE